MADLESSEIIAGIRATAILGKQLTEPLMKIIMDNSIPVTELNTYFMPMILRLKALSNDPSELLMTTCEPFFHNHSPKVDELFEKLYTEYDQQIGKMTETALKALCASFVDVATRQLKDHLPGGLYQTPSDQTKKETKSVRKHNLVGENDFGHLDYCQKQKPNASTKHHSSTIMTKINKTISWIKSKPKHEQIKIHKLARMKAPVQTRKYRIWYNAVKKKETDTA